MRFATSEPPALRWQRAHGKLLPPKKERTGVTSVLIPMGMSAKHCSWELYRPFEGRIVSNTASNRHGMIHNLLSAASTYAVLAEHRNCAVEGSSVMPLSDNILCLVHRRSL